MEDIPQEILDSVRAGARSICWAGWKAEECELAAIERAINTPPTNKTYAFNLGKWAAIDELRSLNQSRRVREQHSEVSWPTNSDGDLYDPPSEEQGFDTVELLEDLEAFLKNIRNARYRRILYGLALGLSKAEVSETLGVTPGRISQLLNEIRRSDIMAKMPR